MTRLLLVVALTFISAAAQAATVVRKILDLTGDFAIIGNTLGHNCAAPAPVVGQVSSCVERNTFNDTSPDLYWRAETSSAAANPTISPDQIRSTAVLALPAGAQLRHAYLYWWANTFEPLPDGEVLLERPGSAAATITATRSHTFAQENTSVSNPSYAMSTYYLSVAEVTAFVAAHGNGAYRVSGVGTHALDDAFNLSHVGWALVAIYEREGDQPRSVALYDGIERVVGSTVGIVLRDLIVPSAGFDGKLAIVGLDGEADGAQARFGQGTLDAGDALSNALNPANRFFNGTRSYLGAAVSVPGDLPQTSGLANSFSGLDIDVVDVTDRLVPGQTSASAAIAAGVNDGVQAMVWVASITTFKPDFNDASKAARDENGGSPEIGDVIEYTLALSNRGNDRALDVRLEDVLPPELAYVAGSMTLTSSVFNGALTDAAGDDLGTYDSASRTISVDLGALLEGEGARLTFQATLTAAGSVANQASVRARGEGGAPEETTLSDGDPVMPGDQATTVVVPIPPGPDAGVDGGSPVEAGSPDVAPLDAGGATDATGPANDAAAVRIDASAATDAGTPTDEEGCNCHSTRSRGNEPAWLLTVGLLLALTLVRAGARRAPRRP